MMGLRALAVPNEPCKKEDSAICQKAEKRERGGGEWPGGVP